MTLPDSPEPRYPVLTLRFRGGRSITGPSSRFADQTWVRQQLADMFHGGRIDEVPVIPPAAYDAWITTMITRSWCDLPPELQDDPALFDLRLAAQEELASRFIVEGEDQ